jgi:hypothetical protein
LLTEEIHDLGDLVLDRVVGEARGSRVLVGADRPRVWHQQAGSAATLPLR